MLVVPVPVAFFVCLIIKRPTNSKLIGPILLAFLTKYKNSKIIPELKLKALSGRSIFKWA